MKIISLVLIFVLASNIGICSAEPGIFMNYSTSKQLVEDLYSCSDSKKLLINCDQQNQNLKLQILDLDKLNTGLITDKELLKKTSDNYKQIISDTSDELVSCKSKTPSRFTWFSIGGLTVAILTMASMFALK